MNSRTWIETPCVSIQVLFYCPWHTMKPKGDGTMKAPKTFSGRAYSIPGGIAYGVAISTGITFLGTLILAWMVDREIILWEQIGYGIMVTLLLASFSGALCAYTRIKRQRLLICLMEGAVYFALLLSITALFFGGQYSAVGVTACLVAGGCGSAGLLGLRQGRGPFYEKRGKAHR